MKYIMLCSKHFMTHKGRRFDVIISRILGGTLFILLSMAYSHLAKAQQNDSIAESFEHFNEVILDDVSSGALLFKQVGSEWFLQAPQLKTMVDMRIKGIVANVTVKQKFTNTSNEWQHAIYAFPLPDNSAVNQLKIKVAERVIIGQIQEKKKALKTYNKAKKNGQKAALVQQVRPNLFTTDVANIPPHESIEVELTYFQQIDYQVGLFSLHFPMAITPRYQPTNAVNNPLNDLPNLIFQARNTNSTATGTTQLIDLNVSLSSGAELALLNSVNHDVTATYHPNVKDRESDQATGYYSLNLTNQVMQKEFKLIWQYQRKALPQVLNFKQDYKDNQYGLLMVLPGLHKAEKQSSRELTFILDTSGSMSGQSMAQAKQAFKYALTSLNENDSFQLISFNSFPTRLFQLPVVATKANKDNAWHYVSALRADGGTEIMSALAMALGEMSSPNDRLKQIVFLTDGAVGNEADIFSYIANNISDKRLFTVGLGTAPNRYFMKKAAEIGRGSYQFISDHRELTKGMQLLFSKLSHPVLTDLKLSLNEPNATILTAPDPIPDVYQNEPLFLSYQINGGQTDSLLTGIYNGEPWSLPIELGDDITMVESLKPAFESHIPAIATLWARRKIADYFRDLMLYKMPESKTNIIDLALGFHLVTPFTSLVAVEEKTSRPHHLNANAKQLKNNLPAGQKLPPTALNW